MAEDAAGADGGEAIEARGVERQRGRVAPVTVAIIAAVALGADDGDGGRVVHAVVAGAAAVVAVARGRGGVGEEEGAGRGVGDVELDALGEAGAGGGAEEVAGEGGVGEVGGGDEDGTEE